MLRPARTGFSLNALAYWSLLLTPLWLLLGFVPAWHQSIDLVRRVGFSVLIITALLSWLIARLQQGKIVVPRSSLLLASFGIAVATILSALVHTPRLLGLWGNTLALGTAWSVAVIGVATFVGSLYLTTEHRLRSFYLSLTAGLGLLLVWFGLMLLLPAWRQNSLWLIAGWSELGALAGLMTVLSVGWLETKQEKGRRFWRVWWWLGAAAGLAVAMVVGQLIWFALTALAVSIFFLFGVTSNLRLFQKQSLLRPSSLVLGACLVILIIWVAIPVVPASFNQALADRGLTITEVRPSLRATLETGHATLQQEPLFGSGPLQFERSWQQSGFTAEINTTPFWNQELAAGYSLGLTLLIAAGLLGVAAWFAAAALFGVNGYRVLRSGMAVGRPLGLGGVWWIVSLYLWLGVFSVPVSSVLFGLGALAVGAFIGSLVHEKRIAWVSWSLGGARANTPLLLTVVAMIIVVVAGEALLLRQITARYYAERGMRQAEAGQTGEAIGSLATSARLVSSDDVLQRLVELRIAAAGRLLAAAEESESYRLQLAAILESLVNDGRRLMEHNPHRHANWLTLGRVYEQLTFLGVSGADAQALWAYGQANMLHPRSPLPLLGQARVAVLRQEYEAARAAVEQALALKPDLVPALVLLGEIDARTGRSNETLERLAAASELSPANPELWFQLGYYRYQGGDYRGAVRALQEAARLVPAYADARYFLVLAHHRLGQAELAAAELARLQQIAAEETAVKELVDLLGRTGASTSTNYIID